MDLSSAPEQIEFLGERLYRAMQAYGAAWAEMDRNRERANLVAQSFVPTEDARREITAMAESLEQVQVTASELAAVLRLGLEVQSLQDRFGSKTKGLVH